MGRATQGVRLIRLDDDDEIASVAKVEVDDEEKKAEMSLGSTDIIIDDEDKNQEKHLNILTSKPLGDTNIPDPFYYQVQ